MLTSVSMNFVNIIVFEKDREKVVEAVIKSGLIHLINTEKVNRFIKDIKGVYQYSGITDINKLKAKVTEVVEKFQIKPQPENIEKLFQRTDEFDIHEALQKINEILFEFNNLINRLNHIDSEITRHFQMLEQTNILRSTGIKRTIVSKYEFLEYRIGEVNSSVYEIITKEIGEHPAVMFPVKSRDDKIIVYLVFLKKDKYKLEQILSKYGFKALQFSEEVTDISENIIETIKTKIKELQKERDSIMEKIEKFKKAQIEYINELFFKTRVIELKNRVSSHFLKTSKTYIISGWIPAKKIKELIEIIEKIVGKNYYVEIMERTELKEIKDVPVAYTNPGIFKPFEYLTYSYGIPAYKTINPVPIMAITYLIMFGVMFGDIGHGLILFLCGIFLKKLKRFRQSSLKNIFTLITYCGLSSILFGFLFGSFFGYEHLIKPLWLKPINNINTLFTLAIGFGILIITTGIIINIINSIITHDFIQGIFSKSGLIGGMIYWGMIIIASKIYVLKQTPEKLLYFFLIVLPLILLFLKEPVSKFIERRKKMFKEGIAIYLIENFVEIIEIVIGYISNTLSFIRIIAFGLAHTGLFIAIFSLNEILKKSGMPDFLSIFVLILGNIGIILLEGIVVSIQAMRLEYYEFFDKFFQKTGIKYEPVRITV